VGGEKWREDILLEFKNEKMAGIKGRSKPPPECLRTQTSTIGTFNGLLTEQASAHPESKQQ
jgi:hypothetical protein